MLPHSRQEPQIFSLLSLEPAASLATIARFSKHFPTLLRLASNVLSLDHVSAPLIRLSVHKSTLPMEDHDDLALSFQASQPPAFNFPLNQYDAAAGKSTTNCATTGPISGIVCKISCRTLTMQSRKIPR